MNNTLFNQKKNIFFLLLAFVFLFANTLIYTQNKAAYILPDIGVPGTNIYIELIAHTDSL